MRRSFLAFVVGLSASTIAATPPVSVLTALGLTSEEIAAIETGRPVAKILSWGAPSEVYVFGAVHVTGSPSAYLRAARDVTQFSTRPGYLQAGELPAEATAEDLRALVLEPEDIEALKTCREGACDVQLPAGSIRTFHDGVNWSRPDVSADVNRLARDMLVDLLNAYRRGGNAALGAFDDKARPAVVARQFETMVERAATVPDVLPELRNYLLRYPDATLAGAEAFFYWEKITFGLKPTVRLNHGIVYHTVRQDRDVDVVAIKQLYASHYFHTALDVSVCVGDSGEGPLRGFYLLTLKSSEQEGLTGLKGSLLRKVVANKSKSSLEAALLSIKRTLER